MRDRVDGIRDLVAASFRFPIPWRPVHIERAPIFRRLGGIQTIEPQDASGLSSLRRRVETFSATTAERE